MLASILTKFRLITATFFPHPACEGGLYPIDGGMISGIRARLKKQNVEFMCFPGSTP